ncbi:hypothetical protein [Amycolatopsis jiangsuensis]|uniref:Uncharacterized protein n=1 Tax=Amycolatopsis jiangsuensis TaxID=1181879 RepID=A0A840J0K7_9PSEU|nr:hypothetical protein [Amycolatopsis jiangsuensis]MBB4686714.1 hypothetical protein [Amycolatopsis jiangsuensis]
MGTGTLLARRLRTGVWLSLGTRPLDSGGRLARRVRDLLSLGTRNGLTRRAGVL